MRARCKKAYTIAYLLPSEIKNFILSYLSLSHARYGCNGCNKGEYEVNTDSCEYECEKINCAQLIREKNCIQLVKLPDLTFNFT